MSLSAGRMSFSNTFFEELPLLFGMAKRCSMTPEKVFAAALCSINAHRPALFDVDGDYR